MRHFVYALLPVVASAVGLANAEEMTAEKHQAALDKLLATMGEVVHDGPYKPTEDSLNAYEAPQWYADAKLGIFMHYGLFSVPGYSGVGCWYGNNMYNPKSGAFKFHRETFGPQDQFGYKDFAPHLTASRFDADEWVALFKEAGARFVVPVSCFHDGFAMWDSKLTDWNAVKKGPKRDYDGLLAAASRKQGLKFGVAWHAFFRPDFFRPGRRPGTDMQPPYAGTPWSIYGPGEVPVSRAFIDDSLGRLVELIDGYRPDLIWFDFDTQYIPPQDLRRLMTFYYNRAAQWKKGVAVNDKHEHLFPSHAIVLDYERGKTSGMRRELWQTDTSVSWRDWSYMRNDSFKTVDELVRELVDIVSKNGVLLLDIGPRPDGSIPPEPQAILRGIGAWLKVNGEAIYGTRPCRALGFGEGPHNSGGGGFSDKQVDFNHHDFRFTQKGGALYAVAMDWPDVDDHFLITSLSSRSHLATGGIAALSLLGSTAPLDWKLTDAGLWIRKPDVRPSDGPVAFKIELRGVSVEKLSAQRVDRRRIRIEIGVRNLDSQRLRQEIDLQDNGNKIGSETFNLEPCQSQQRVLVLGVPQKDAVERITASAPGGRPLSACDEVVSPPILAASRRFDGEKVAISGLGRHPRLTISLWTRVDALKGPYAALLNTSGWSPGGMHVQYLEDGNLQVALHSAEAVVECVSKTAAGNAAGWQMITVTYDTPGRRVEIYVNGKLDTHTSLASVVPINLDSFALGGWDSEPRRLFGQMADVRIYDRVLSPAEIAALLHGRASHDALLAAWDFAQPEGNVIRDVSGHGHDGAVVQ